MSTSKRTLDSQNQFIKWFGVGFLIMIGIMIGSIINRPANSRGVGTDNTVTRIYTSAVLDIANEFLCACGSCNEPNLAACTCDTAKQEKNLIHELLNKGYDRAKVIQTIEAMFGGRKS